MAITTLDNKKRIDVGITNLIQIETQRRFDVEIQERFFFEVCPPDTEDA